MEILMSLRRLGWVLLLVAVSPALVFGGGKKACVPADEVTKHVNKDICVAAHVYDVVQLPDGIRFLDMCSPETPDERCRFTVMSLREDRDEVGELRKYRDTDVRIRGVVQPMHGRVGMVLSNVRQFNGGPPKFKPNPRLARGFDGEQSRPPVSDPNLRSQGGRRAFMNTRDQVTRPVK
jgi:hypothetical protein